jgi:hypothetical protein
VVVFREAFHPSIHPFIHPSRHPAFAIYIFKKYVEAKEEELWKLKYFHHPKIIIFKKKNALL